MRSSLIRTFGCWRSTMKIFTVIGSLCSSHQELCATRSSYRRT